MTDKTDSKEREPTYLCQAWGETDLPSAAIVQGLDAVREFLVEQWLGDADQEHDDGTKALPAAMADMQEQWALEGEAWKWSISFEIGGISVQRVDDVGRASLAASAGSEPVAWTGGEEWEQLAWHLCAEEHGEDACDEVIWEGGPIPEPWGARWMKYESDAKRMIELVRRFYTPPSPPEGMVMVPKEPTEDMLEAVEEEVGGHCYSCSKWRASYDDCRRIWAAMIAAIPPTSSADSSKDPS